MIYKIENMDKKTKLSPNKTTTAIYVQNIERQRTMKLIVWKKINQTNMSPRKVPVILTLESTKFKANK